MPRRLAAQTLLGWQRLTVRDNGMGMSPEVRTHLRTFYTTKGVGRGTWAGLATIWHLTTEAGGRVELETIPGNKVRFTRLPVWPVPTVTETPTATGSASPVGRARVLLVEDDDLVASSVVAVLERAGHEVDVLMDGAKGCSTCANPTALRPRRCST